MITDQQYISKEFGIRYELNTCDMTRQKNK